MVLHQRLLSRDRLGQLGCKLSLNVCFAARRVRPIRIFFQCQYTGAVYIQVLSKILQLEAYSSDIYPGIVGLILTG